MLAERKLAMSASFPSFMSVYGSEESTIYNQLDADGDIKIDHNVLPLDLSHRASPQHQPLKPLHHRTSVHSLFTESTDSSPTTTGSTFDSPIVFDNSASCSPESATDSIPPPSPFQPKTMSHEPQSFAAMAAMRQSQTNANSSVVHDATRNVKSLTLDMNVNSNRTMNMVDSASLVVNTSSAPISPLREPLKSARKKPTNLSIKTPSYNQSTFLRSPGLVPPTPSSRPMLHQYPSSPALFKLASPHGPPTGGMLLPLPKLSTHSKHNSSSSNASSFFANYNLPGLQEEDTLLPKSGEAPERGYTDGPVRIYDSGVYLYLEPTACEASEFDTVINVAREVENPFREEDVGKKTVLSIWRDRNTEDRRSIAEPQTAISEFSFKTANEWPAPEKQATPTTPTQQSYERKPQEPEYVHVGWDHNSEILEDLYPLCQLIDDRVKQGKKVLIHCQLGVSRSASLIIAYGLFKGYQPDFHSMYMAVKDRSRWVGPNMSLIYQLTDFKSRINRGSYLHQAKGLDPAWFSNPDYLPPAATSAPSSAATDSATAKLMPVDPKSQLSARKPSQMRMPLLRLNKELPPVPLFSKDEAETRPRPKVLLEPINISSAIGDQSRKTPTAVKRAASRPLPFRERNMDMSLPEHEPRQLAGITLTRASAHLDLAARDVPETPSLFSPRATEFSSTPWGIQGAGDLMTPSSRVSREVPSAFSWLPAHKRPSGHHRTASKDPRAPMQVQETRGLFRSIEDYL